MPLRLASFVRAHDPHLQGFRRNHYYVSKLRHWESYRATFEYLDAKSQGLLATTGILGAVFLLAFEQSIDGRATSLLWHHPLAYYLSALGVILVIFAAVCLMRCFSVVADRFISGKAGLIDAFEDSFGARSDIELEARIERFVELYTAFVFAPDSREGTTANTERQRSHARLLQYWMSISSDWTREIPGTERLLACSATDMWKNRKDLAAYLRLMTKTEQLFRALRKSLQREIDARRRAYRAAFFLVYATLLLLILLMISLVIVFGRA